MKVGDLVRVRDTDGTGWSDTLPIGIVAKILEPWDDTKHHQVLPTHVGVLWADGGPMLEEYVEDLVVISEVIHESR